MKRRLLLLAAAPALINAAGCHRQPAAALAAPAVRVHHAAPRRASAPALSAAELSKAKPNEAGLVPILEYHNVIPGKSKWFRTPDQFRHDLARLYKEGYRPVSMSEYLQNRIDLPYGFSPVILTFDDADASQFQYRPDGSVDPNCAVGILQAFHTQHPDFALKGTFFVLPESAFGKPADRAKKLEALLKMGFEIGNHTITHTALSHESDQKVQWELATNVKDIRAMAPDANVDILALPYGIAPRNKTLEANGQYGGVRYHNVAVFLVGANPAPSVIAKRFNPMKVPRIQAVEGVCGITYWLDQLKEHPAERYVSDGDASITTVPAVLLPRIDKSRLNGATLRTYKG